MKLSITPISFAQLFRTGDMDLPQFIVKAKELELDGVDLLDSQCYPWLWQDFNKQSGELDKLLNDNNIKLGAYGCGNNFATTDSTKLDKQVELVCSAIIEAARVGASTLRIFGGYHQQAGGHKGITYANGFWSILNGIERCIPVAEKNKVILALENHGRLPGHSYEIKAILEHFNTPWLSSLFDCANFMANNMDEPEDPLRAYDCLRGNIAHVHVKDFGRPVVRENVRVEAHLAGEGDVPLRQMMALLEQDGYKGYCSLEYECSFKVGELEGVEHDINYFKQIKESLNVLNIGS